VYNLLLFSGPKQVETTVQNVIKNQHRFMIQVAWCMDWRPLIGFRGCSAFIKWTLAITLPWLQNY